jgi:hypothetical protein
VAEAEWIFFFKGGKDDQAPKVDNMQPRFFRHPLINNRNQRQTRRKYKKILKVDGVVLGARGEIIVIPKDESMNEYWVLGGAHLIEALYDAYREDPSNLQILASLKSGIPVTRLDIRSPSDVQRYFKTTGNILNNLGSGTSFTETYLDMPQMSKDYVEYQKELRKTQKAKSAETMSEAATTAGEDNGEGESDDDDWDDEDDNDEKKGGAKDGRDQKGYLPMGYLLKIEPRRKT